MSSNSNLDRRMMARFSRLLNDLALKEVYLNGRHYTWSNERSPPTFYAHGLGGAPWQLSPAVPPFVRFRS